MKKNIILAITGSIAAYKAADIVSELTKRGRNVEVVMTKAATEFITPLTFQTLSKNRVYTDIFVEHKADKIQHITLAQEADVFVIAPATANIIAKLANGFADDMVSALGLTVRGIPKFIAPAMNTRMYENPIVQENVAKLAAQGYEIIEPRVSTLACGDFGKGAMAQVNDILQKIERVL